MDGNDGNGHDFLPVVNYSPNSLLLGFLMQLEMWPPWWVGVVGFLGSEVVLCPVVSHCLRLSPFMWGVGVGWCGRFLGL